MKKNTYLLALIFVGVLWANILQAAETPTTERSSSRRDPDAAMTTPGDTTTASLAEVEKVMKGAGARVDR